LHELATLCLVQMARPVAHRYPAGVTSAVLAKAIEMLVDGPVPGSDLWAVMRFATRDDAIVYVIDGMRVYLPLSGIDLSHAFYDRAKPFLFREKWQVRFFAGAAFIFSDMGLGGLPAATARVLNSFPIEGTMVDVGIADQGLVNLVSAVIALA